MTKFYKLTKQNVCVYNTYYTHCLYLSISNIIKNTTDFDLSLTYTQKEQQIYNASVCLAIVNYWFLFNKNKEHYYLVINYFRYKIIYIKLPRYFNDNLVKEYSNYYTYWISDGQKGIEECCINYLISDKKIFRTYTSLDRYKQTDLYKEIMKLKNEAKAESDLLQKQREDSFKLKEIEAKDKKQTNFNLTASQIDLLLEILKTNNTLVDSYKQGYTKVLNTIVGKYLAACKLNNIIVDPAAVSYLLKTKYLL